MGSCLPNLRAHFGTLLLASASAFVSAQSTTLRLPTAIAYDSAGNLYIADTNRHQVLEATLGGKLRVVAGTGTQGFSGDGSLATAAQLNGPQGIAIAPDNTLYIADTGNHRIRAIDANGIITTIAGTGKAAFAGDGAAATRAALNHPTALVATATTLYVADTDNHRIRTIANGLITTVAGTGTQGFSGDNGAATAAQLDSPQGLALAANGSLIIADTHNQRLRSIDASGIITTLAAHLSAPHGLATTADGAVLAADTNNQRLQSLSAAGILTTLAGIATQGTSPESTPATSAQLNLPRAVVADAFASPVIADTGNARILILWNDGFLHPPAALVPSRTTTLTTAANPPAVYGAASVQAAITGVGAPRGTLQVADAQQRLATTTVTNTAVALDLSTLSVGAHALTLSYSGDGVNPAVTQSLAVTITPASATATPSPLALAYGQPQPALTGTLTGILPQDAATVSAAFGTAATPLSAPGTYLISATLTGPAAANYTLTTHSASLTIARAGTTTTASATGQPLQLSASVAPAFGGAPTGSVTFLEGTTQVAAATLTAGIAAASWNVATAGSHTLTAQYSGDANFLASSVSFVTTAASAQPDFTLAATTSTQDVQAGGTATYPFTVTAQPAPFNAAVSFSVTGLPAGAIATFSPTQVVPGTSSAQVTLSITTAARAVHTSPQPPFWLAALVVLPLLIHRRRRVLGLALLSLSLTACGDRVFPNTASAAATYNLQVTATSTAAGGSILAHTMPLTLTVH